MEPVKGIKIGLDNLRYELWKKDGSGFKGGQASLYVN